MSNALFELHTSNETSTFQTELAVCDTIQIFPLDGNWTLDLTETAASVHTWKISERIIFIVSNIYKQLFSSCKYWSCMNCKVAMLLQWFSSTCSQTAVYLNLKLFINTIRWKLGAALITITRINLEKLVLTCSELTDIPSTDFANEKRNLSPIRSRNKSGKHTTITQEKALNNW